jgi:hypothetical protein
MNQIIAACKSGHGRGNAYSRMKAAFTGYVKSQALKANLRKVDRADWRFRWVAEDKRSNPDGISAGVKFCYDGLQQAKVIANDGWAQVASIHHDFVVGPQAGVEITIVENSACSRT